MSKANKAIWIEGNGKSRKTVQLKKARLTNDVR
jgi:hypothetical protein